MGSLKNCPFCGGSKIDLSMTVSESIRNRYYKVAYYCKSCSTYGPRVIYKPEDPRNRYAAEKELQKEDSPIRLQAEKLWNTRNNSQKEQ